MSARSVDVVIVAAGGGVRFGGDVPKQFLRLSGRPMVEWSVRAFREQEKVGAIVIVVPRDVSQAPPEWLDALANRLVAGGRSRAESVARGVAATRAAAEVILIHDGVRPFVSPGLIERVTAAARETACVPILPVVDTIKELTGEDTVVRTLDRSRLGRAQTPQGFPAPLIRRLVADPRTADVTDDVALCEPVGIPVRTVPGDPLNIKITAEADLEYAEWLVRSGRRALP